MKRTILAFCAMTAVLSACASKNDDVAEEHEAQVEQQKEQRAATERCLDNPKLAKTWGDCNAKKTIFDGLPKIKKCYKTEASKDYDFHGDLMLRIRVWGSGKVRDVKIEEGSLRNRMLSGCLVREISRLQFAKPPKGVNPVIYFPFTLDIVRPDSGRD